MNERELLFGAVREGLELPPLAQAVTATTIVLGAMASRDWRPMHHDRDFAVQRNGVRDIFLNTPAQAAWFERFITDWSGPRGRIGRMKFSMKNSIFPGDTMTFSGRVTALEQAQGQGFGWVDLALAIQVGPRLATECRARVALPVSARDNPWLCKGSAWAP